MSETVQAALIASSTVAFIAALIVSVAWPNNSPADPPPPTTTTVTVTCPPTPSLDHADGQTPCPTPTP